MSFHIAHTAKSTSCPHQGFLSWTIEPELRCLVKILVMVWLTYGLSFQCLWVVRMWKDNLPRDLKGLKQRWHSNCSPWICVASMWSFKFVQTLEILPHSMHWYIEAPVSSVVFERKDWTILSMAKSEHVEATGWYRRSASIHTYLRHWAEYDLSLYGCACAQCCALWRCGFLVCGVK